MIKILFLSRIQGTHYSQGTLLGDTSLWHSHAIHLVGNGSPFQVVLIGNFHCVLSFGDLVIYLGMLDHLTWRTKLN